MSTNSADTNSDDSFSASQKQEDSSYQDHASEEAAGRGPRCPKHLTRDVTHISGKQYRCNPYKHTFTTP